MHDYYGRLMEAFRLHSGLQDVEKGHMANFVSHFVLGLSPELCLNIQQNVNCWQTKTLDEILRYVKYCSDEMESRQKKLKEKYMIAQTKLAQGNIAKMSGIMQGTGGNQGMRMESCKGRVEKLLLHKLLVWIL